MLLANRGKLCTFLASSSSGYISQQDMKWETKENYRQNPFSTHMEPFLLVFEQIPRFFLLFSLMSCQPQHSAFTRFLSSGQLALLPLAIFLRIRTQKRKKPIKPSTCQYDSLCPSTCLPQLPVPSIPFLTKPLHHQLLSKKPLSNSRSVKKSTIFFSISLLFPFHNIPLPLTFIISCPFLHTDTH